MSERPNPRPPTEKLTAALARDYPDVREVLLSFPDEWELVQSFRKQDLPLYAAAWPWEMETSRRDHFRGLPADINLTLNRYRHHWLFRPWPQPTLRVTWDAAAGAGRVVPGGHLDLRLEPLAKAQVWAGDTYAVLWECYLLGGARWAEWQNELLYGHDIYIVSVRVQKENGFHERQASLSTATSHRTLSGLRLHHSGRVLCHHLHAQGESVVRSS